MKAQEARDERTRLLQEAARARAAGAEARNCRPAVEGEIVDLKRQQTQVMVEHARRGASEDLAKRTLNIAERLAASEQELADADARLEAAARGERDAQTELGYLLKDELGTFLGDARGLAKEAEAKLGALAPAIAEVHAVWQAAALEYARLSPAVAEALRERDRAAGVDRPAGHYEQLVRMPAFPLPIIRGEPKARPAAVDELVAKPEKARAA
jgi:hypothetical protein